MKHFEELWVLAEKTATAYDSKPLSERKVEIEKALSQLDSNTSSDVKHEILGRILFQLCGISAELNVNTFRALAQEEKQIRLSVDDLT